jgi:hypothetical protein
MSRMGRSSPRARYDHDAVPDHADHVRGTIDLLKVDVEGLEAGACRRRLVVFLAAGGRRRGDGANS